MSSTDVRGVHVGDVLAKDVVGLVLGGEEDLVM